ncbi:delta-60 repeat domain-containing protein [Micromonospora thermarum]|uniref:Delta-60 repeat domain-containing protein n=1 Tax=Micromonospora thermarum TaxID=2720024 RepID=A0ABX0Z9A5_9ACTN|nr:delta-60 repeat domain-containing protein [Micromonospora thermarum]NJP33834.1 delta-60 repeat domain-containing protein [Micromonospora thermarum]
MRAAAVGLVTVAAVLAVPSAASAAVVPAPETQTLVSANPADATPHARDGETRAFAQVGSMVYVGGSFTQIRQNASAAWTTRSYLFAYDRTTGTISTTFLPVLDGPVNSLIAGPNGTLIVGGGFKTVNGVSRKNLVALNATTGAIVDSWVGRSDGGMIRDMVRHDNWLYVAGAFNWINGTAHNGLARLNFTTGAIDSGFNINATVGRHGTSSYAWTIDVTPDGNTLVVGGNFTSVNGLSRNQMALVDLSGTPSVINWSTEKFVPPCARPDIFVHYVQDVKFGGNGTWFVVGTNGGAGWPEAYCDALVRFETAARGSGQLGTWVDYTGNDTITSVEVADNVIYLGGHFRWLNNPHAHDAAGPGAVDRLGIAAVTPATGMPVHWNPGRRGSSSMPAGTSSWGSQVPVLWRGSDGLYFGHNSDGMGGEYHGRLGMFPLSGGRYIVPKNPPTATTGNLYLGTGDGTVAKVPFNGASVGTPTTASQPNYTGAGATWRVGDRIYWAHTVAGTPTGSRIDISIFNGGTIGVPWESSGYNDWFNAASMTGAFFLNGRLYYTRSGANALYYRYFETDGNYLGATEFTLPTTGVTWSSVRGMAWVAGKIVYGGTDGTLRSVPFDPTASPAVNGSGSVVVAPASAELSWSTPRTFFSVQ